MILFFALIMTGYYFYNINVRGMTITNVAKIQDNYPAYMVKINDEFVDYMVEFEDLLKEPRRVYSKEELQKISENMNNQNKLMITLQKNPPNKDNKDYLEVYKDYLKLYAFYIQGEVMRVEFVSAYKEEYTQEEIRDNLVASEENYIIGIELCNMMGTMILENPVIVNKIHNTDVQSKHDVIPLDEWKEEVSKKIEEYEKSLENEKTDVEDTSLKTNIINN